MPFSAKMTLSIGWGFEAWAAHPVQTKSEYPFVTGQISTPDNCEKWANILRKIPQIGTFSCQNDPLKWVGVLRLEWHIQTISEYPSPVTQMLN